MFRNCLFAFLMRPFVLLLLISAAKEWVEWNDEAEELASKLPGPLTIILPIKEGKTLYPTPDGGTTLGIRVSSHPVAQELATRCGKPLSTTSANIHGEPPPYTVVEIAPGADCVLDSGTLPENPPSQVIDLTGDVKKTLR